VDMGYLESGLSGSLAQLLICAEIVGWIRHALREVEVSEETLALERIVEKGPDSNYLQEVHTRRRFREHWYPWLFDREPYSRWLAQGERRSANRLGSGWRKSSPGIVRNLCRHPSPPLSTRSGNRRLIEHTLDIPEASR